MYIPPDLEPLTEPEPDGPLLPDSRKPRNRQPDPEVQKRNKRNKRHGRDAQRQIARLTGSRDIGTLGGIDLDGGWFWGEVKDTQGLPEWFKKGMAQLGQHPDRPGFLFVRNARQGVKAEVFVIQTIQQWEGLHGKGDKES